MRGVETKVKKLKRGSRIKRRGCTEVEVKDTKVMRELEGEGGHADGPKNIDED